MRFLLLTALITMGTPALAEDCGRELVESASVGSPGFSFIMALAGKKALAGIMTERPEGRCQRINENSVNRHGGSCADAFSTLSDDEYKYNCYQEGKDTTKILIEDEFEVTETLVCYFCEDEWAAY